MHNLKRIVLGFSILLVSIITFSSCDDGSTSAYTGVRMIDNTFSPPVVRVHEGGLVRFYNAGNNPHNVIATDAAWGSLEDVPKNDYIDVNFDTEGLYKYICSYHATPEGDWGMAGSVVVGDIEYQEYTNFTKNDVVNKFSGDVRYVPSVYETIQDAVDASNPGDLVLIDRGIYYEEVVVRTPSITIRGIDRNEVIIDGEFEKANGIIVAGVDGVAVENITARNALLNGFYWATSEGYRASYVTAYNNGDYGIYAFDSVDGIIEHSYASGSPDAGFYIGQCYPCDAVINNVISENNGLGYSGTNSGGDLYIVSSVFRNNMGGIAPNTLDSELLPPERESFIIGNHIENNNNTKAPAWPNQYITLGNGIIIAGGNNNVIKNNVINDHNLFGVVVTASFDDNYWPAHGNLVQDNIIINSNKADMALSGVSNLANCFKGNSFQTSFPPGIQTSGSCGSNLFARGSDLSGLWSSIARVVYVNKGSFEVGDWRTMPEPPLQANMPSPSSYFSNVFPAVDVFANYDIDFTNIKLPETAEKYLN